MRVLVIMTGREALRMAEAQAERRALAPPRPDLAIVARPGALKAAAPEPPAPSREHQPGATPGPRSAGPSSRVRAACANRWRLIEDVAVETGVLYETVRRIIAKSGKGYTVERRKQLSSTGRMALAARLLPRSA